MNQERIYKVLLGPHVSEKASLVAEHGQPNVEELFFDLIRQHDASVSSDSRSSSAASVT